MRRAAATALLALAACEAPAPPPALTAEVPAAAAAAAAPAAPQDPPAVEGFTPEEVRAFLKLSPLPEPPLDPTNKFSGDPGAARLGQFVFFDPRFSGSGKVSCATCHVPEKSFTDGKHFGEGAAVLERHTPSLWNVAYNRWFFWDGRADSLWAQALQPVEEPREHGISRLAVAHTLYDDADLRRGYEDVFGPLPELGDVARFPPVGRPLPDTASPTRAPGTGWRPRTGRRRPRLRQLRQGARRLRAPARLARGALRRVRGRGARGQALRAARPDPRRPPRAQALRRGGALRPVSQRAQLHRQGVHDNRVGPLLGGTRLDAGRYDGIPRVQADPFNGLGAFSDAPQGEAEAKVRYLLRAGHNWSEFKTPSLRNVVLTAPYMHQGQLATLDDVLQHYNTLEHAVPSHHQGERTLVPLNLSADELADLREFLESLTDAKLAPELLAQPPTPYLP
jgi:cytochrome c peroxidase